MPTPTRTVYWKGKFEGRTVVIDAHTFDPAIHSDTPWKAEKAPKGEKAEKAP